MAELCQPIQRESVLGRLLASQDLLPSGFQFASTEAAQDEKKSDTKAQSESVLSA